MHSPLSCVFLATSLACRLASANALVAAVLKLVLRAAMASCSGITRAGKKCQITHTSSMVDSDGRSVAGPLRRGSPYCLLHAKPFMYHAVSSKGPFVLFFLDLETTGTSVGRCRVVELAAAQAFDQPGLPGACFAEVVRVPYGILQRPEAQAAAVVHGISNHEIETSHTFPVVWERFLHFVDRTLTAFVKDDSDSEQDQVGPPRIPDEPPLVLLAAHNGYDLFVAGVCTHGTVPSIA